MSDKMAKRLRKEARRLLKDQLKEKLQPSIPIAGCPQCGFQNWYLELDDFPPNHTKLVSFICAHPECQQKVIANIDIAENTRAVQEEYGLLPEYCDTCGEEKEICVCE